MPLYEYDCAACGDFTALRPMAEYREPQPCPDCGQPAPRALFTAPSLPILGSAARTAHARNERSAHEPMVSKKAEREVASKHGAGCACCKPGVGSARTQRGADGAKSFPSKRPWMISH